MGFVNYISHFKLIKCSTNKEKDHGDNINSSKIPFHALGMMLHVKVSIWCFCLEYLDLKTNTKL